MLRGVCPNPIQSSRPISSFHKDLPNNGVKCYWIPHMTFNSMLSILFFNYISLSKKSIQVFKGVWYLLYPDMCLILFLVWSHVKGYFYMFPFLFYILLVHKDVYLTCPYLLWNSPSVWRTADAPKTHAGRLTD
jgi:hypothetical protein